MFAKRLTVCKNSPGEGCHGYSPDDQELHGDLELGVQPQYLSNPGSSILDELQLSNGLLGKAASDACYYNNNLSRTSASSTNVSLGSARPSPPHNSTPLSTRYYLRQKYDGGRKMSLIPSQILIVAILLSYFSILCNYKAIDMPAHQTYGGSWKFLTFIYLVEPWVTPHGLLFGTPDGLSRHLMEGRPLKLRLTLKSDALLLRAARNIGLEVPRAPLPERSRLDDWYVGAGT
ncbi:hypothetical protein QQF64_035854 [Cirrhinus molitorella]|uniref:Uncharacterized protein n=1 Tax=Cirrhinus molitorella TaxID=172907 RepID=A0ABR3NHP5_9TELE